MTARFDLDASSQVIEIASNDGYMLQYFVDRGIPVLGIEPSANTAAAAMEKGVPTEIRFFGRETAEDLARQGRLADLLVAKNVMAHVPDINDFVSGIEIVLKPQGVFTVEFPHLLNTIEHVQFDTIYHEHFTYLSLTAVEIILRRWGLRAFDVEEYPTHGGSLRVFVCKVDARHERGPAVDRILEREEAAGLRSLRGYQGFTDRAETVRDDLLRFFATAKARGKQVAGYGAAAKGNTLLNYAGIDADDMTMIADLSPAKQGRLAPGSHIPIVSPDMLMAAKPDYVLILPWNLSSEIKSQLSGVRDWGGWFVTAIPELTID